jgi:hypothetical protein
MPDQSKAAMDYFENARKSGRAITGQELRRRFTTSEMKSGLTMQGKKLTPKAFPPDEDADSDIVNSQSLLRKKFMKAKGY